MQASVGYNYSKDYNEPSHVFMFEYIRHYGTQYRHLLSKTVAVNDRPETTTILKLIDSVRKEYDLTHGSNISTLRGIPVDDYMADDDELEKMVDTKDYLNYIYLFGQSGNTTIFDINTPKSNKAIRPKFNDSFGICMYYSNSGEPCIKIDVAFDEEGSDNAMALFEALIDSISSIKAEESKKSKVNFICQNAGGLYLRELKLKPNKQFDLYSHYNDDFHPVAEYIEDHLKNAEETKGIILLHGMPGTGKTSYLRNLIANTTKSIIYVSPDMSARVSDPAFLSFLMEHRNSILIIEDAENILKTREAGENQAVSNLLNITDGILGDGLNFQVICTFNVGYDEIDPALKREGRLIAEYEFGALSEAKTKALVHSLYGDGMEIKKSSMTLAEIFNMREKVYKKPETKKHRIGF